MFEFPECGSHGFSRAPFNGIFGKLRPGEALLGCCVTRPTAAAMTFRDLGSAFPALFRYKLHSDRRGSLEYGCACWSSSRLYPPFFPNTPAAFPRSPDFLETGTHDGALPRILHTLGARVKLRVRSVGPVPASATYRHRVLPSLSVSVMYAHEHVLQHLA